MRAASDRIWLKAGKMKSANWISGTGRRPLTAAPIDAPTIIDSVSGVSSTRSPPNSSNSPSVARKTPPFLPTSSPSTTIDSSRRISSASVLADRLDHRHDGHGSALPAPSAGAPRAAVAHEARAVSTAGRPCAPVARRRRRSAGPWPDPDRPAPRPSRWRPRRPCASRRRCCRLGRLVEHARLAQLVAEARQRVARLLRLHLLGRRGTWSAGRPTSGPSAG